MLNPTAGTLQARKRPATQLPRKEPGSWGTDAPHPPGAWLRADKVAVMVVIESLAAAGENLPA